MREHKIVSPKRAREEVGEESLNGHVKGSRHGCSRRNRVTSIFSKWEKDASVYSEILETGTRYI